MNRSALAVAIATILTGSAVSAQQPATPTTQSGDRGVTGTTSGDSRSSNPNRDTTNRNSTDTADRSGDRTAADSTNRPDEKFLKTFAAANAAEVDAGKMAADKAQNSEVKAYAKHMVDDHSKTLAKVETLAGKTNVDVKAKPDMMHKAKSAMLDNKSGAAFDEAYMKSMVSDHEKVVAMLQMEIRDGKDASVKQLASQALPDVQKHLKMAKDLEAKVSNDKSATRSSARSNSDSNSATSPTASKTATDQ